jgi:hypothetical protein
LPVPAERDGWSARERRTNHVEVTSRDVGQIPDRRHMSVEMRIVGEHGLTRDGQGAVNDPIVRAECFARGATEQQIPYGIVSL